MKNSSILRLTATTTLLALLLLQGSAAPVPKKKKDGPPKKDEKGIKPLKEITKGCAKYEGLFTLYQDTTKGDLYLLVTTAQLGKDHLYFRQVADGVVDAGYFRGSYGSSRLFQFERYFERLEVRLQNTTYAFDPASPLSRAAEANINKPVLLSEAIVAANKKQDSLLIKADQIFLGEGMAQIKYPPADPAKSKDRFTIGKLDKDRSKVIAMRSYPKNTDVLSEYVFVEEYPKNFGGRAVGDARSVAIRYYHSLIELPEIPMAPRMEDPRIGYFSTQVNDMTTTEAINWRDRIHRWDLRKKDPAAAVSEPIEPIVWWIENTTPHEIRPSIRAGVEAWNIAFEKAGFLNAVVVKQQPDDATWDAGDIRYNVLRWTSSPTPPFGGYGPSFVDPRTGQILGADIMLEYIFVTNRIREQKLFETAGMGYMAMDHDTGPADPHLCHFAADLHENVLYGLEVIEAMDLGEAQKTRFVDEAIRDLLLHEVGHTLGLNHNMKASSIRSLEDLKDKERMEREGVTGSVMDYSPANLPFEEGVDPSYFHTNPGPYDIWAIQYGYTDIDGSADVEDLKLKEILARSKEAELLFGNDADDMRAPGRGIDPRVMIFDLSNDPVAHGTKTIELADRTLTKLLERYGKGDRSYHELLRAYGVLTGRKFNAVNVMSRQIGGVYVDRSFAGQQSANKPYAPVPAAIQKKAMQALADHAFAPAAFTAGNELLAYLQPQRRGFDFFRAPEDPRVHDRILFAQRAVLDHLLHPNTLQRIVDSRLYGNAYDLGSMMTDLTNAIFLADRKTAVNTMRQNLQSEYVDRLIQMMEGAKDHRDHAQAMAHHELKRISAWMKDPSTDLMTRAHRDHQLMKIDQAMRGKG